MLAVPAGAPCHCPSPVSLNCSIASPLVSISEPVNHKDALGSLLHPLSKQKTGCGAEMSEQRLQLLGSSQSSGLAGRQERVGFTPVIPWEH